MMVYVVTAGGLASAFVTLPIAVLAVVSPLSYAIGAGLSMLFLATFPNAARSRGRCAP